MLPLFYSLRWFSENFMPIPKQKAAVAHCTGTAPHPPDRLPRQRERIANPRQQAQSKPVSPVFSGGTPIYLTGEGAQSKGLSQTFDSL